MCSPRFSSGSSRRLSSICGRGASRITGERFHIRWIVLGLVAGLPVLAFFATGAAARIQFPNMGRFNVQGGVEILPEFAALLFALTIYTAAFIAEVVRAGMLAVPQGQTEAAQALGLRPATTLRRSSFHKPCASSCRL